MTDSKIDKQASSFFNKNLTNADNDNSMNISTKMDMSLVNKPAIQRVNCAILWQAELTFIRKY